MLPSSLGSRFLTQLSSSESGENLIRSPLNSVAGRRPNRLMTYLSKYASTSSPSTTLSTLHLTISNISSHTFLGTFLNPLYSSPSFRPGRPGLRLEEEEVDEAGKASGEGANQTSNNFSGPSNGPGEDNGSSIGIDTAISTD
jgi:hypothetical protein